MSRGVALLGVLPRTGDTVRLGGSASFQFRALPVERFRILHAAPITGRGGWCLLHGIDLDTDPCRRVVYHARVVGLVIRPGDRWPTC